MPYVTFEAADHKTACKFRELFSNWGTFRDGCRPEFASKLSTLPREGETVEVDGYTFKVVKIIYHMFGDVFKNTANTQGCWHRITIKLELQ